MIARLAICFWLVCAGAGEAQTPLEQTQRPLARGDKVPMRPIARNADLAAQAAILAEQIRLGINPNVPRVSLRPVVRPARIVAAAQERRAARLRGQVCGDAQIQGEAIGRINGRGDCGVANAVRIKSVAGVRMIPQPTIDCRTAKALKSWVTRGAKPAVGNEGGGISSMRVVSHYACRNRNSAATGRLSEHAFGRAIDIAGIKLKSGREITVLRGWNTRGDGARLRKMWRAACGPFGTVLGPEANRFHADHFHFDTARYRSGSYCR